jgi:hypothetical protein
MAASVWLQKGNVDVTHLDNWTVQHAYREAVCDLSYRLLETIVEDTVNIQYFSQLNYRF